MSSVVPRTPAAPSSIGPYRVLRELGRGGMGIVFEAEHPERETRVAIKTLRPHLQDAPQSVQRFLREGRVACRIQHPHVVRLREVGSEGGAPYLVMDLLDGVHLGTRLAREGPMPITELVELMLPIVAAVAAAHAAGVVHRDLKPSNIMLASGPQGEVVPKVLDFGTSKFREQEPEELLTTTGQMLGTLYYMAPEQARAPKSADARSDQYSLGLILYECATGRKPFSAESAYDIMQAIMAAPVALPSTLQKGLPKQLDRIVMRAIRRVPEERYPSVAALGLALLELAPASTRRRWEPELTRVAAEEPNTAADVLATGLEAGFATTLSETGGARVARVTSDKSQSAERSPALRFGAIVVCALTLAVWIAYSIHDVPAARRPAQARPAAPPALVREARPAPQAPSAAPALSNVAPARAAIEHAPSSEQPKSAARSRPKNAPRSEMVRLGDNGAPILE
jgi:serine/threonine protein kinase